MWRPELTGGTANGTTNETANFFSSSKCFRRRLERIRRPVPCVLLKPVSPPRIQSNDTAAKPIENRRSVLAVPLAVPPACSGLLLSDIAHMIRHTTLPHEVNNDNNDMTMIKQRHRLTQGPSALLTHGPLLALGHLILRRRLG